LHQTFDNIAVVVLDSEGLECIRAHFISGEAAFVDDHGDGCYVDLEEIEKMEQRVVVAKKLFSEAWTMEPNKTPSHILHSFLLVTKACACAVVISP
jgi:hypothetical protein